MNKIKEYWDVMATSVEDNVAVNHWVDSEGGAVDAALYAEIATFVLGEASDKHHPKILEVGCGSGNVLDALDRKCLGKCDLHGCDISQKMLDRCVFKGARYVCAAADQLPFDDQFFDVILIHGVVQYFESMDYLEKVLKEFGRVLANDGVVCIMDVPNIWYKEDMTNKKFSIKLKRKAFSLLSKLGIFPSLFSPMEKIDGKKIQVPAIQGLYVDPQYFKSIQNYFSSVLLMLQDFPSKPIVYKKFRFNVVLRK